MYIPYTGHKNLDEYCLDSAASVNSMSYNLNNQSLAFNLIR